MSTSASRPASEWSRRLAAALTERGVITGETAQSALAEAARTGRGVAAVLLQQGAAESQVILAELTRLSGIASVDIFEDRPMGEAFKLVPELLARDIGAIGYRLDQERLTLACAEPLPNDELRRLSEFLGREVAGCVLADPIGIERIMEAVYPRLGEPTMPDMSIPASSPASPAFTAPTPPAPATRRNDGFDSEPLGTTGFGDTTGQVPASAPPPPPPMAIPTESPGRPAVPAVEAVGGNGSAAGETFGTVLLDDPSLPESSVPTLDLDDLLTYAVEHGASDLHLANQLPPCIRVDGALRPIEGLARLDNEQIRTMVYHVLTQNLRERFEATKELDASHMIMGVGRFRVNVFQQRSSIGAVLRAIPHEIPPFDSLGLPDVVSSFAELRRGLVLVTGPTGSGKSTTLASLVNIINRAKPLHIMTVEDPIEFLHSHGRAIVNQREVGTDTESFSEALRHVLRQDPDVILVGEMRDIETIGTALTAAETGHLVFATLHTQDAPQTIDRIIDVFPTAQQDQVRIQLAGTLEAVVTQQLILSATGLGRVPVAEVMICTPAIRNLIRSAKTHQIYSLMQTGGAQGMQTMDQGLARAVRAGRITEAVAFDRCHDPAELRDHMKG